MTSLSRPLVILSDLHLVPESAGRLIEDLEHLIRSRPGHEIILNGDTFTLSADPDPTDPLGLVDSVLATFPALAAALRDHLARGDALTLVAGNHDAALALPTARARLLGALGLSDSVALRVVPWFLRRHALHVEHGHVYDPDNAPAHPLAPWSMELEPLGVKINRRLIVPLRAGRFAHAHETTPLRGLLGAFRDYGLRAFSIIIAYFVLATVLVARAGRPWVEARRRVSNETLFAYGEAAGLAAGQTAALFGLVPLPTLHSRWATFRRLYLDRALACSCLIAGALAMSVTASLVPGAVALGAGLFLVGSLLASANRYAGRTEQRLRHAARNISALGPAELVVFSHSHVTESSPPCWNTGCFACRSEHGRPYLLVDESGHPTLEFWRGPDKS